MWEILDEKVFSISHISERMESIYGETFERFNSFGWHTSFANIWQRGSWKSTEKKRPAETSSMKMCILIWWCGWTVSEVPVKSRNIRISTWMPVLVSKYFTVPFSSSSVFRDRQYAGGHATNSDEGSWQNVRNVIFFDQRKID